MITDGFLQHTRPNTRGHILYTGVNSRTPTVHRLIFTLATMTTMIWVLGLLLVAECGALRVDGVTRRAAVVAASAHALLPPIAALASASDTRAMLKEARSQLDPCEGFINDGSWDGVRNVVKTAPLANVKTLVTKYISEKGEEAEDLVVTREDLVQALSMLDMTVYNNVFVSEELGMGKKGAGVKVDRATVSLAHLPRPSKLTLHPSSDTD